MKKLLGLLLVASFGIAVCYAVPYGSDVGHKTELAKKHFELQVAMPVTAFEVPAAPAVVYDLIVPEVNQSARTVVPQSNSPPRLCA